MRHKLMAVCLAACMLLTMSVTAFARDFDPDRTGSISVVLKDKDAKKPIVGAELSLYYVADVKLNNKNHLSYTYTEEFEDCDIPLDDRWLAEKLDIFVEYHAEPVGTETTDAKGYAAFTDLPPGLYFVKQTESPDGETICTPFLVTLPFKGDRGYEYDINASPKTDVEKLITVTIRKVWNTDESTKIADHVMVQLLRNDVVITTANLNPQNNWKVTYTDMPESDSYSIKEINVPKGFTATYSQNGYEFTVTNSASLIQTGQIVWPIPVLAMAGLILISLGTLILQKSRAENE